MDNQFLSKLIESNTRVILPDFGAFLVKDDSTGVFKPENVTFSPFLRYNDGVVEDYLSTEMKVGKDQAREQLVKFIDEIRETLQANKSYPIQGLGSLQVDSRGSIQFTTSTTQSSTPAVSKQQKTPVAKTAGDKVEKPVLETKPEEPVKPEAKLKDKLDPGQSAPNAVTKPKETTTKLTGKTEPSKPLPVKEYEEPTKKITPIKHKETYTSKEDLSKKTKIKTSSSSTGKAILYGTLIGIGFVTIMASGWYLYSTGFFTPKTSGTQLTTPIDLQTLTGTPVETTIPEKGVFEDEFNKISEQMDETTSSEKVNEIQKVSERRIVKENKEDGKLNLTYPEEAMFHIIVGSFRNADYAEKYSKDMRFMGYNSKVIAQPTGMHAVSLGSFLIREHAVDSMDRWKLKYPNIWILMQ